jgi:hypothetical protein
MKYTLASDQLGTPYRNTRLNQLRKRSVGSPPSWLNKFKKNEIFEAIQEVGLHPEEFDLRDDDAEVQIKHKSSVSCFTIGGDLAHFVGRSVVGDFWDQPFGVYSWHAVIQRISSWLSYVKLDLKTPDLWAELHRGDRLLFSATSDDVTENSRFTPDEQNEIATRLQTLAEDARRTYSLSAEQMRVLEAKLDYLVNAARRLGRKDWLIVCAGVILTLLTSRQVRRHSYCT